MSEENVLYKIRFSVSHWDLPHQKMITDDLHVIIKFCAIRLVCLFQLILHAILIALIDQRGEWGLV